MYDKILVRYGDLTLKGNNKKVFIEKLKSNMVNRLADTNVVCNFSRDRLFIDLNNENPKNIMKVLDEVSGIYSYSLVSSCETNIDSIKERALELINLELKETKTFKVETKRSFKQFDLKSPEITKIVAGYVLSNSLISLNVDVVKPEITLNVEVRDKKSYVFLMRIKGLGGFPCGIAGKGLLLLSGGIDSAVAGVLMQKQGVEIEAIHFESTPLTSVESAQKVIDLVKVMSKYAPKSKILLHLVHFKDIHSKILEEVPERYSVTIMRRIMYKIASVFSERRKIKVLCNGESIGQVASQTLSSINVVSVNANIPIIRPLATYDKIDIIDLSKKYNLYDISIRPFEDCCTVYLPKNPVINPKIDKCIEIESKVDFEELINSSISEITTIKIDASYDRKLFLEGLDIKDILKN